MAKVLQPVNPPSLAKAAGYSHGIEVQGVKTLFISGQVAFDKDGQLVGRGDIVRQFSQICQNLKAVLLARAGQMSDIVKLTIYVLDKSAYKRNAREIGAIYREFFGRHYPAMTFLEVKGLYDDDRGCLMEIEAVAVVN
jgi:enamine deaminase RidA (YjgF/YER057c/UK114 family)